MMSFKIALAAARQQIGAFPIWLRLVGAFSYPPWAMRTLEDLQDALDHELAWRRVEIQAVRSVGRRLQAVAQDAVCRAGVAMLYAHWEGYVRAALAAYLSYVARRRLKYRELSP